MMAVDAAVQSKMLGAQHVHLVYRRGPDRMNASKYEQDLAASHGINIITNAEPIRILGNGFVQEIEFAYTIDSQSGLQRTDDTFCLKADQMFKATGQTLTGMPGL